MNHRIIFFFLICNSLWSHFASAQSTGELVACGDNQVVIFDPARSHDTIPFVTWRWKASAAFDLPREYRSEYFRTIDECKPVRQGTQLLITSSSGGVALIDKASSKTVFYARVGNAHSAELLPGDRIAVAASTNDAGNRIELYDIDQPEVPLFHDSLYSGHGAVWDERRQLLYALGYNELRSYRLQDWDTSTPSLALQDRWTIPGISGHDLATSPQNVEQLLLTEHESVWVFDKNSGQFSPYHPLQEKQDIKAVSIHPENGTLAYVKAETSWWSHRVYLNGPEQWLSFPGIDLYKVRWMPPATEGADIIHLVGLYVQARENRDTQLLKTILTPGIDQLVSSGTWRQGINAAVQGMLNSSSRNPGKRTITVERIRQLSSSTAIADARYEIANANGSVRKMWSTFVVARKEGRWKIAAIRNMLPAGRSR